MNNSVDSFNDFIHPLDRSLSSKIMTFPVISRILDIVFDEKLDSVNQYLYHTSCIMLPDNHSAVLALRNGERFFNINQNLQVYTFHSYDFDIKIIGYHHPVVLVPSRLLEENNAFLLEERIASAVAAVIAGHNKLDFLLWIYDNFSGIISLPVLSTALIGLINEWRRSRQYTIDRAFLLYTKNYVLSKMNILYGNIPYSIFKNFDFKYDDSFQSQVNEFFIKDGALDLTAYLHSILQNEVWFPSRYKELSDYYKEELRSGLDM